MKLGKRMILQFENDRCSSRSICGTKLVNSSLLLDIFDEPDNEEQNISVSVRSSLIFCNLEDYLYKDFWLWLHLTKKLHVTDYIGTITDETCEYSSTMLHKICDITGYICGHRVYNLIHLNRLHTDYKAIFQNYYTNSRLIDGHTVLLQGLPAVCLRNNEHSTG